MELRFFYTLVGTRWTWVGGSRWIVIGWIEVGIGSGSGGWKAILLIRRLREGTALIRNSVEISTENWNRNRNRERSSRQRWDEMRRMTLPGYISTLKASFKESILFSRLHTTYPETLSLSDPAASWGRNVAAWIAPSLSLCESNQTWTNLWNSSCPSVEIPRNSVRSDAISIRSTTRLYGCPLVWITLSLAELLDVIRKCRIGGGRDRSGCLIELIDSILILVSWRVVSFRSWIWLFTSHQNWICVNSVVWIE